MPRPLAFPADGIPVPGQPLRLGYLGNSLCYTNGAMPNQAIELARTNGDLIAATGNAPGGWSLSKHAVSPESLIVVSDTTLNLVALQQASQGVVDADSLRILGDAVSKHHGRVLLYETWGILGSWKADIPRIRQNYLAMAEEVPGGAAISPVGLAWWWVLNERPDIVLFQDDRHPTLAGAYLAGCVNYASIFGRSPVGNSYLGKWRDVSLDPATAAYLQKVAEATVFDNPRRYETNHFLWAYNWKDYSDLSGSKLPGTVVSGGGGQPSPAVKLDADAGKVDSLYLGVLDSANIAGQGRLYILDKGRLSADMLVAGKEGKGFVKQTGGTLCIGGTLTLGAEAGSYGSYALSGSGILDAGGGCIDIRNGLLGLAGGTLRLRALDAETNGAFVDTPESSLILSDSQSTVSVASGAITINSRILGGGGLIKTGAGTLVFANANRYSGDTSVNAGSLIVSGMIQGSTTSVNAGAILLGSGTVGALRVAGGGTLSPGNGIGMLTSGNTTFEAGGILALRLANAAGSPRLGWNSLNSRGKLDLSGLDKQHPFTVRLQASGSKPVNNFSGATRQEWPVVHFVSLTGSFAGDEFVVDTTGFGSPCKGTFSIGLETKTKNLLLIYTPGGSRD